MIAFTKLGQRSRLGNHMFQYAYLRSMARRLGVPFYCPRWEGDDLFVLDDAAERAPEPAGLTCRYVEPPGHTGVEAAALAIADGTDVQGYFQSERYFIGRADVLHWYRFQPAIAEPAARAAAQLGAAQAIGLHVRLGDFVTTYSENFYVARRRYYQRALAQLPAGAPVLLFSDDAAGARRLLGRVGRELVAVDGLSAADSLCLQTHCGHFVTSASTFAWWGCWLNPRADKTIVAPAEGPFRPGAPVRNADFWPADWLRVPALRPGLDHYRTVPIRQLSRRVAAKLSRLAGARAP